MNVVAVQCHLRIPVECLTPTKGGVQWEVAIPISGVQQWISESATTSLQCNVCDLEEAVTLDKFWRRNAGVNEAPVMPNLDAWQRVHLVTDMRCLAISWTRHCRWRRIRSAQLLMRSLDALADRILSYINSDPSLEHSALVSEIHIGIVDKLGMLCKLSDVWMQSTWKANFRICQAV